MCKFQNEIYDIYFSVHMHCICICLGQEALKKTRKRIEFGLFWAISHVQIYMWLYPEPS